MSAPTALYGLLDLPDSPRKRPEPTAISCSETSSLHHHTRTTSPAIARHRCDLTTSTYKHSTSARLLPGGAQPGSRCTATPSACRTVALGLAVLTGSLPKLAISNAPRSRTSDDSMALQTTPQGTTNCCPRTQFRTHSCCSHAVYLARSEN